MSQEALSGVSVIAVTEPADALPTDAERASTRVPEEDELIANSYRVVGVIGGGAMGVVYLAVDVRLNRSVALKVIRDQLPQPGFRMLFREEARAMAAVNHPNVVTIYSFGEHGDRPFLAMELVQGKSLDRLLDETDGELEVDRALGLLDQACQGLIAIHEAGAVHRDIKPSNLLVDAHDRLRICDLGLATSYRDAGNRREVVGTPGYIAPEILLGQSEANPRSDVYSLGCVAYELLAGRSAFRPSPGEEHRLDHLARQAPPPSEVRPGLPQVFDGVIMAALERDPHRRTASAERFRQALLDARSATLDPTRILVVDDDADTRLTLQMALEAEFPSAEVEVAADGEAALAAFSRRAPSVVVSDLQMPGTDGVALVKSLRARPEASAVPIVLLTASGGADAWRRASALGADGFVVKPANVQDLAAVIRRTLRERRARSGT